VRGDGRSERIRAPVPLTGALSPKRRSRASGNPAPFIALITAQNGNRPPIALIPAPAFAHWR
jgi:hypothetical protein